MADLPEDLEETVRRADPDRWLASRFIADSAARADVVALYAFDHVLARVPAQVSEPLMGEIRLTWWSETLEEIAAGKPPRPHPVALGLALAVQGRGLDAAPLHAVIEARIGDLDGAPLADEAAALAYAEQTAGALMQAAAQALGAPPAAEAARMAGRAYGLALMAQRRALGGRTRLPSSLDEARLRVLVGEALATAAAQALPVAAFPALAYACLARPYARGASPSVIEKQLRLVWGTARGRL